MKESYIKIRIQDDKKEEFRAAIEKNEPNLNMTIVLKNFIDAYIKGVRDGGI